MQPTRIGFSPSQEGCRKAIDGITTFGPILGESIGGGNLTDQ